jgi:serine phosphatase RsbU (regulator of sigma subunit)
MLGQQSKTIDSLNQIIKSKINLEKADPIIKITREYIKKENFHEAFEMLNQLEDLGIKNNASKYIVKAYSLKHEIFERNGEKENVIIFGDKINQVIDTIKDVSIFRDEDCWDLLSSSFLWGTDYNLYIKNTNKFLSFYSKIKDGKNVSELYSILYGLYYRKGDTLQAEKYLKLRINTLDSLGDKKTLGHLYRSLAFHANKRGYLLKSLLVFNEIHDYDGIFSSALNLSGYYKEQGHIDSALYYNSLQLSTLNANRKSFVPYPKMYRYWLIYTMYAKAKLLNIKKDYFGSNQTLDIVVDSLKNKTPFGNEEKHDFLKNIYDLYSKNYTNLKQYEKASTNLSLKALMSDSLVRDTVRESLLSMQSNYEKKKNEKEIELLEKDKMLKDTEIKATTEEKKKQQIIIYSVAGILLLVIVFSLLLYKRFKLTAKQKQIIEIKNKETEQQKLIIEEKNKDITDSINYAKRIQQAKLPNKQEILNSFPQSFVLFKPKDIVSGDFYYFTANDQGIFIASADCTGHGVPGAFMSMIGSEKLDDAVAHSSDTSEILKHLNKGIKTSLKQSDSDESTRDGMDIAICSVDIENRIVKYAGANRPFWLIRKGQAAVEEIKATKKAIGGLTEDNQHFDSHEIKLQEGDTFYLSTDGYADTFGKDGKKMMTKQFKEVLLSIQHKTMKEQEKYLDEFVENWKAGTEQVDDILVIGIRL